MPPMMSFADEPTRCGFSRVPVMAASPDIIRTTSSGSPVIALSPVLLRILTPRLGFRLPSEKYNLWNNAFIIIERIPAMDSRQLRYFIAVYEQRNLSRAADQANVAQSALSHHIAYLEAEFA